MSTPTENSKSIDAVYKKFIVVGSKDYHFGYDFRTGEIWTEKTADDRPTPYIARFNVLANGAIELASIDEQVLEFIEVQNQLGQELSRSRIEFPLKALIERAEAAADAVGNDEQAPPCYKAPLEDVVKYASCGCYEFTESKEGDA